MLLLVWLDLLLEELDQLLQDILRLVGHLGSNRGGALVDLHGNLVCQVTGDFVQLRIFWGVHSQLSSVNISVITGAGSSPGPHTAFSVTSKALQVWSMFLTGFSSGPTRIPFKTNCTLNRSSGPPVRLAASLNMVNKSHRRPFKSCPGGIGSGAT